MRQITSGIVLLVAAGALIAAIVLRQNYGPKSPTSFLVYGAEGESHAIILPRIPSQREIQAAELMRHTLSKAAGRHAEAFPIRRETDRRLSSRGIFIGRTRRAEKLGVASTSPFDRAVTAAAGSDGVTIASAHDEDIVGAVAWWLEKHTGAHWFMPSRLGEQIPRRSSLRLAEATERTEPAYLSRNFSIGYSADDREWFERNRLLSLFEHYHSMGRIFKHEDLLATPELAPIIDGRRYRPATGDTNSWQPNLVSPLAVLHASSVLKSWLTHAPEKLAVSLSMNDTVGYDQSPETVRAAGNRGYFRQKPDYSDLVFGFVNRVAKEVAKVFPDRFVTTYAYDWAENTPSFPVEPNVIPFLTADRTQWFDADYGNEDRELIERWVKAGPRFVGIYDYLYGVTFLVPRPAISAVASSIPFAHRVGVRAYYAESSPNWGLDGPKAWLAAQLLWQADRDPSELLDTYYREFWQGAALAMRAFFDRCEQQWLHQPKPAYWIKYFKDEHQSLLFPSAVREELRLYLSTAVLLAKSPVVRERVEMVCQSFAVSDAFVEYSERRDALTRQQLDQSTSAQALLEGVRNYLNAKRTFLRLWTETKKRYPIALAGSLLPDFTRNEPLGSALRRIAEIERSGDIEDSLAQLERDFPDVAELRGLFAGSFTQVVSQDAAFRTLNIETKFDSTTWNWGRSPVWRGYGFPSENRMVKLVSFGSGVGIRMESVHGETLQQWLPAEPGALYQLTARFRAKVSPGNMTILAVYWADDRGRFADIGTTHRIPVGAWSNSTEFALVVRAPRNAARVIVAVRVSQQVTGDFAEFAQIEFKQFKQK